MKSRMIFSGLVCLAAVVSGCASSPTLQRYSASSRTVSAPELNKTASAEVGQSIVSKAYMASIPAIRLSAEASENINLTSVTRVGPGVGKLEFTSNEGNYYKLDRASYPGAGIFIPSNNSGPPVVYLAPMAGNLGKKPVDGVEHFTAEEYRSGSFRRDLIYLGVSKNVVSISYREFSDNTARPAFTQDVKYDLDESKVIGYRGARFEVIKASNTSLEYRVLKHLD